MNLGRPVKNIDLDELKHLMSFYPSLNETSGWFDCSPDTISRIILNKFDMTFAEFRARYFSPTKIGLKKVAIEKALAGNDKLLIHLLRTLTQLDDREKTSKPISNLSDGELINQAQELIDEIGEAT